MVGALGEADRLAGEDGVAGHHAAAHARARVGRLHGVVRPAALLIAPQAGSLSAVVARGARSHVIENCDGLPLHWPLSHDRLLPTLGVPLTTGRAVFAGLLPKADT